MYTGVYISCRMTIIPSDSKNSILHEIVGKNPIFLNKYDYIRLVSPLICHFQFIVHYSHMYTGVYIRVLQAPRPFRKQLYFFSPCHYAPKPSHVKYEVNQTMFCTTTVIYIFSVPWATRKSCKFPPKMWLWSHIKLVIASMAFFERTRQKSTSSSRYTHKIRFLETNICSKTPFFSPKWSIFDSFALFSLFFQVIFTILLNQSCSGFSWRFIIWHSSKKVLVFQAWIKVWYFD